LLSFGLTNIRTIDKMPLKLVKVASENKSKILDGLNDEQQKAVCVVDGPLLIVAGAGSGKTRVLTHRVAYLIEKGINPYNILALTFTNKAAREMVDRISRIVPEYAASKLWAGTFHSIFARLLRYEAEHIGYTSSFSIYDTDDSLAVVKSEMNTLGINQQQFPAQAMRSRISWAKNQLIDWQAYSGSADTFLQKQTAIVFEAYEKALRANNAMDFDDLLNNMIYALRASDDILEKYQERFKYILVDEYQDTNRAQYIVINLLAKKHKNICVVGDDAQSIYRWRGAEIQNILDFQKDYNTTNVIRLERNYRSTKTILAVADSIIKHNRKQIPKKLWTDNSDGEQVSLLSCLDDRDEAARIVGLISEKAKTGKYEFKDFAILYRTNAQSLALENAFKIQSIPYVILGGISFYKRKEVKDVLSYLKLLVNPLDSESLLRVINEPPRGIGNTSIRYIKIFAEKNSISLYNAFLRIDEIEDVPPRAKNAVKNFTGLVEKYRADIKSSSPYSLAFMYITETGIMQMYKEINTDDSLDRWNNIQQFLSDISDYFNRNENAVFEDYLNQLSLLTDIDEKDTSQNQVKLMTLHSAKGLEFPVVIIAGLEEGLFPLAKAEMHFEEEEEERRLFYVGITRAQELLYLTYANRRLRFGDY
jgi:DNA helicase-2/ATP-dependent DNA helicase PcrA